jgi:hypothetical protein
MVYLTLMDESYSLLIGLNYSSDCDRWYVVEESYSDAETRHGQQDHWTYYKIWSDTEEAQNYKVSDKEIELYRQISIRRAAVEFVTQRGRCRNDIGPAIQQLLKILFPGQSCHLSVSLYLL